eukprot:MONOS_9736.1-p1 / transcript=MONOS_9736.1 / gene=MONOS_9736 / organism=Monocercomonoides_exilis_PA203 / gene_product=unspecified product / transcript_product=unspecified product / location=Mono_scaffold00414:427-1145(-) / protein_length=140 / sequence_SO=supercontig / SO=protein_coding / is_pseudo=false
MFSGSAGKKGATAGTLIAAVVITVGLWLFIDGAVVAKIQPINYAAYICIIGTVIFEVFIFKNAINGTDDDSSDLEKRVAQILFFICVVVSIGGNVGAFCIAYFQYIKPKSENMYSGIMIFVSSILFLVGFTVFRFTRQSH